MSPFLRDFADETHENVKMNSGGCLFTILVAYYKSMYVAISNFWNNVIFRIFEVCQIFKIWAPLKT